MDYAFDMADALTNPATGEGASIYAIGLGNRVEHSVFGTPNEPEQYMEYASEFSGGATANHGVYYYASNTSVLNSIFLAIYNNITTRIAQ